MNPVCRAVCSHDDCYCNLDQCQTLETIRFLTRIPELSIYSNCNTFGNLKLNSSFQRNIYLRSKQIANLRIQTISLNWPNRYTNELTQQTKQQYGFGCLEQWPDFWHTWCWAMQCQKHNIASKPAGIFFAFVLTYLFDFLHMSVKCTNPFFVQYFFTCS